MPFVATFSEFVLFLVCVFLYVCELSVCSPLLFDARFANGLPIL